MLLVSSSGSSVLGRFAKSFNVLNIDYAPPRQSMSNVEFFQLGQNQSLADNAKALKAHLSKNFGGDGALSGVISTAGGFEMSEISSPDVFESYSRMFAKNSASALLAAHVAASELGPHGVLVLTGALTPYKSPTPNMLTYSLSKNFVHTLNLNLAKDPSFVKKDIKVYTILPSILDTQANREAMPDADKSDWIETGKLSDYLYMLCTTENRPESGSFIELTSHKGAVNPRIL